MCALKQFQQETLSLSVTWSARQIWATITFFIPVSESTPAAAVTEIDQDSVADRDVVMVTKLESLMESLSASVDVKNQQLSDTMDGKMATLEQKVSV